MEDLLFRPGPPGVPELFRVLTPPGTTWGPARGAGHTHGGQIALPFTPDWSWLTFAKKDEVNADGWAEEEYGAPGNRLYVNRGIGFRLMRIGAAPELTLFTLTAGTAR